MNILGIIPADPTSDPISYYRVISPFKHLAKLGHQTRILTDREVSESALDGVDVVVTCRVQPTTVDGVRLWRELIHAHGATWVLDLDDDDLHVPRSNPAYVVTRQKEPATLESLRLADLVTVTTDALADAYRPYNTNVAVLPNCVDSEDWDFDPKAHRTIPHLTVGVAGGSSHVDDWRILESPWRALARQFPDLHFVAIGYLPSYMMAWGLGQRLHFIPWNDLPHYRRNLSNIDIGCCPLQDTPFNRGKSPIKAIEYAMLEIPYVASPTVYGQPCIGGALASSESEWAERLGRYVSEKSLRRLDGIGNRFYARDEERDNFCIENRVTAWEAAYARADSRPSAADRTP